MNRKSRFQTVKNFVSRVIEGETVLLHLDSGKYFGMDRTSMEVWEALDKGKSVGEICDQISRDYSIPQEQAERDIGVFINQLASKKLIVEHF